MKEHTTTIFLVFFLHLLEEHVLSFEWIQYLIQYARQMSCFLVIHDTVYIIRLESGPHYFSLRSRLAFSLALLFNKMRKSTLR